MYPAQFEYSKAGSVAEAIQILRETRSTIIAGGHQPHPDEWLAGRGSRVVDIGASRVGAISVQ